MIFTCPFCSAHLLRQQDRGSFYYHPPSRECALSNEGAGLDRWTRMGKALNQAIDRKLTKPVVTHVARESVVVEVSEHLRLIQSGQRAAKSVAS